MEHLKDGLATADGGVAGSIVFDQENAQVGVQLFPVDHQEVQGLQFEDCVLLFADDGNESSVSEPLREEDENGEPDERNQRRDFRPRNEF